MKEREKKEEKRRGRPGLNGGNRPTAEPRKDPRNQRKAPMHPPHPDTRATRSAWKNSHEDSHRGTYVLIRIFYDCRSRYHTSEVEFQICTSASDHAARICAAGVVRAMFRVR